MIFLWLVFFWRAIDLFSRTFSYYSFVEFCFEIAVGQQATTESEALVWIARLVSLSMMMMLDIDTDDDQTTKTTKSTTPTTTTTIIFVLTTRFHYREALHLQQSSSSSLLRVERNRFQYAQHQRPIRYSEIIGIDSIIVISKSQKSNDGNFIVFADAPCLVGG